MDKKPNRILIIEDDAHVLSFLVRFAERAGWEAVGTKNGPEALKIFKTGRFNLLLSDIDLHDSMDGIEVVQKILKLEPSLRVVMMSGDHSNRMRAAAAGLDLFLPKPIEPGTIADLLELSTAPGKAASAPAQPNCILLVEDEPAIRELLANYINIAGWQVVAVKNASEAMRIFEPDKFHLLLTDVMLCDEIDGIELARRLRTLKPELRVVLISGVPGVSGLVKEAGLGPFLPKPLDLPKLTDLL